MISQARIDYASSRLDKCLLRASPPQLLQAIWACSALSARQYASAAQYLNFPSGVRDQRLGSPYSIHIWELETLLTEYLLKSNDDAPSTTPVDLTQFATVAGLINRLKHLEGLEAGAYLESPNFDILTELHRIAQRQFHWQRGYFNMPQLYRYSYIYAQGTSARFFNVTYGIDIADLILVGYIAFIEWMTRPWLPQPTSIQGLLDQQTIERSLPLLRCTVSEARKQTRELVDDMTKKTGHPLPIAFLPNFLRRFPLVALHKDKRELIAPIPQLALMRVTSGLYYDLVGGGSDVLRDANERFEEYCSMLFARSMRKYEVRRAYRYAARKAEQYDTPDLLVSYKTQLCAIVECKATKLTHAAQFSEDPFAAARAQYDQIVKAVAQLWRFMSHVRQGVARERITGDTAAIVLTLEPFALMSAHLKSRILAEAKSITDKDGGVIDQDQIHIIFCSVHTLEGVLLNCDEEQFIRTTIAMREQKYAGWELAQVSSAAGYRLNDAKEYPFDPSEILPWWRTLDTLLKKRNADC